MKEFERCRLVPLRRETQRLAYELVLFPGRGRLPQVLGPSSDLSAAGICNDCTLEVRYYVRGGAGPEEGEQLVRQRASNKLTYLFSWSVVTNRVPLRGVCKELQKPERAEHPPKQGESWDALCSTRRFSHGQHHRRSRSSHA